jgi:hypothetical protein
MAGSFSKAREFSKTLAGLSAGVGVLLAAVAGLLLCGMCFSLKLSSNELFFTIF